MTTPRWLLALAATTTAVVGAAAVLATPTSDLTPPPRGDAPNAAAIAGHLDAALAVLTLDDHGRTHPPRRWQQARVEVAVTGPAATRQAAVEIDATLAWLTEVTGVDFTRTDQPDAPLQVHLAPDVRPLARLYTRPAGGAITRATAQWDPTHHHAARWRWEELLHAAGPVGDYGPAGAVLATDQTARHPSAFDAWLLAALYQPADVPADREELTAALATTRPAWRCPTADTDPARTGREGVAPRRACAPPP